MAEPASEFNEKRLFPRIQANCPILYRPRRGKKWLQGNLSDFSATGFSMTSELSVANASFIEFRIRPGINRSVPQLHGCAKVIRVTELDDHTYRLSCKLIKLVNPNKNAR